MYNYIITNKVMTGPGVQKREWGLFPTLDNYQDSVFTRTGNGIDVSMYQYRSGGL